MTTPALRLAAATAVSVLRAAAQNAAGHPSATVEDPISFALLSDAARHLQTALDLPEETHEDEALDVIYAMADGCFRAGAFGVVDEQLASLDPSELPTVLGLAWASITSAAADKLPHRAGYMTRLRAHLETTEPDRVDELLAGFETVPPRTVEQVRAAVEALGPVETTVLATLHPQAHPPYVEDRHRASLWLRSNGLTAKRSTWAQDRDVLSLALEFRAVRKAGLAQLATDGVWCVEENAWCGGTLGDHAHALRELSRWRSGEASALGPGHGYHYEVREATVLAVRQGDRRPIEAKEVHPPKPAAHEGASDADCG